MEGGVPEQKLSALPFYPAQDLSATAIFQYFTADTVEGEDE